MAWLALGMTAAGAPQCWRRLCCGLGTIPVLIVICNRGQTPVKDHLASYCALDQLAGVTKSMILTNAIVCTLGVAYADTTSKQPEHTRG